jgi:hypothetical protein
VVSKKLQLLSMSSKTPALVCPPKLGKSPRREVTKVSLA